MPESFQAKHITEMYAANPQHRVLPSRSDVQLPILSITPEHSGLGSIIPPKKVKGIWRNAELLSRVFENNVSPAPSKDPNMKMFYVESKNESPVPYFVQGYCCSTCHTSRSHGKVTCRRKMQKHDSICSHAADVAEKCGDLEVESKSG